MRDYTAQPVPRSVWEKPSHFIAFGFGSGAVPFAPGTFGTLMAIPFYLAMQSLPHSLYLWLVVVFTLASMWLCDKVTQEIGVHDHLGMCLDEIIGYLVTMYGAPHGFIWILLGFLLFRLFDIWKPWPIGYIDEHIKGGVGIILDDVLAGIYSLVILRFIFHLLP
jgi:phosphatidylglycerophosphatase A